MGVTYNFRDKEKRVETQFYFNEKLNWLLSEEITYDNLGKILDVNLYVYNISDDMVKISRKELQAQGVENVHDLDWTLSYKTFS